MKAQVYVENYMWPIWVTLLLAVAFVLVAFRLNQTRDLGEGIIPARPGRKDASRFLQGTFGLSVRLTRNIFIGWMVCMFLLGMSYGSVLGDLENFLLSNDFFKQFLNAGEGVPLIEQFVSTIASIMAIVAAIPAVLILLKIRSEEKKGHNENILARNVSKTKLLSGYFVIAVFSSIVMLLCVVFGLWSASFATMAEPIPLAMMLKLGLVYLPAIWVMMGITLVLISYLPRLTSIVWAYLGYAFFTVYLGRILDLPGWVAKLSPFGHVPQIPVEEMNIVNLTVLTGIAVVLTIAGFVKYNKREMMN